MLSAVEVEAIPAPHATASPPREFSCNFPKTELQFRDKFVFSGFSLSSPAIVNRSRCASHDLGAKPFSSKILHVSSLTSMFCANLSNKPNGLSLDAGVVGSRWEFSLQEIYRRKITNTRPSE